MHIKQIYIADDGQEFDNEEDAIKRDTCIAIEEQVEKFISLLTDKIFVKNDVRMIKISDLEMELKTNLLNREIETNMLMKDIYGYYNKN